MRLEREERGHNNQLGKYVRLTLEDDACARLNPASGAFASRNPFRSSAARFPRDTVALARFLLGKIVVRRFGTGTAMGRIVETEAYLHGDPACHAFRGMTPRNRSLFLDVGHAYVYLCYGTSYMLNVSSESAGTGAGVLLRALEPISGIEHMRRARSGVQHLRISRAARGAWRRRSASIAGTTASTCFAADARGSAATAPRSTPIGQSVRIGLTKGADARLRYFVAGNGYLSGARRLNVLTRSREHLADASRCSSWTARSPPSSSGAAPIFAIRSGRRNACIEQPEHHPQRCISITSRPAPMSRPPRPIKQPSRASAARGIDAGSRRRA